MTIMNNNKPIKLTEQDLRRIITEAVAKVINGNFTGNMFNKYLKKAYECADMNNKYKLSKYFPDIIGEYDSIA